MKIYDRAKEIHVARFPTTISCSSATTISTRRAGRIYSSRRYLMKYFFSAGEASGDPHAGELIEAIAGIDPDAGFAFLGGDCMTAPPAV